MLKALSETHYFTDEMLETVTGKLINAKTLKNMQLIKKVTPLSSDISESMAMSNLMEDFPLICKKESLSVQMALIGDYFETTGKLISLDEVPEEMYGGKLPVDKGRKSKRKEMTEEEYLEVEQPSKKAKKVKASDNLKIGGSGVPSVQEEAQELDPEAIICKKTRSGKPSAPTTLSALEQSPLKKRKRTPAPRKLKELVYVTKEIEGVEAATKLVTREVRKKKAEEAAALQKALEVAREIEAPASSLSRAFVAAVAEEVLINVADLQRMATSEAGSLMMV